MISRWILILALMSVPVGVLAAGGDLGISKSRLNWNTWKLEADGLNDKTLYLWDFGDGSVSDSQEVTHSWTRPGKYKVTLSGSDSGGNAATAETEIAVGFWHIQNIWLQAILGVLVLGVLTLTGFIIFDKLPKIKNE